MISNLWGTVTEIAISKTSIGYTQLRWSLLLHLVNGIWSSHPPPRSPTRPWLQLPCGGRETRTMGVSQEREILPLGWSISLSHRATTWNPGPDWQLMNRGEHREKGEPEPRVLQIQSSTPRLPFEPLTEARLGGAFRR